MITLAPRRRSTRKAVRNQDNLQGSYPFEFSSDSAAQRLQLRSSLEPRTVAYRSHHTSGWLALTNKTGERQCKGAVLSHGRRVILGTYSQEIFKYSCQARSTVICWNNTGNPKVENSYPRRRLIDGLRKHDGRRPRRPTACIRLGLAHLTSDQRRTLLCCLCGIFFPAEVHCGCAKRGVQDVAGADIDRFGRFIPVDVAQYG